MSVSSFSGSRVETHELPAATAAAMMREIEAPLRRFQTIVRGDRALQAELRQAPDWETFIALVIERCRERGLAVSGADVAAELDAAKRAFTVQWLMR